MTHLKADHCKNQNSSLCQECGILHGYTQKNVHLSSWCPYRTSEINISGFQDCVHKHKLHFTFCKNRGKKIPYSNKPQRETKRACYQKKKHSISTWILVLALQCSTTDLVKISKITAPSVLLPAGEERERSSWHSTERQTVRKIVMDKGRIFKNQIIWSTLSLLSQKWSPRKSHHLPSHTMIKNPGIHILWFIPSVLNMIYFWKSLFLPLESRWLM